MMLTPGQIGAFREDGFLVIEGLLAAEALRSLRAAVGELLDRSRGMSESDGVYDVVAGTGGAREAVVRRIFNPA